MGSIREAIGTLGGYDTNPLPMDGIDPSREMEDMSRNDAAETAGEVAETGPAGSTISCLIFKLCGSLCSGMSRGADMGNGPRFNGPTAGAIVAVAVVVGAGDAIE